MEEKSIENTESLEAKHKANIIQYLSLKEGARMKTRCHNCWHARDLCICSALPALKFQDNISIVIYMDSKEVFNAGDDAKLLLCAAPSQTKRFLYGLEDQELVQYMDTLNQRDVVVLFPSDFAISFPDWITTLEVERTAVTSRPPSSSPHSPPLMTVIVVDAVWRHARRMAQRLRDILPSVRHVQLTPDQMSVYARKQSEPGRICTVEAAALFLSLYGENEATTDAMVQCVRINNAALRPKGRPKGDNAPEQVYYSNDVSHPAWYFGRPHFKFSDGPKKKHKDPKPRGKSGKGRKIL